MSSLSECIAMRALLGPISGQLSVATIEWTRLLRTFVNVVADSKIDRYFRYMGVVDVDSFLSFGLYAPYAYEDTSADTGTSVFTFLLPESMDILLWLKHFLLKIHYVDNSLTLEKIQTLVSVDFLNFKIARPNGVPGTLFEGQPPVAEQDANTAWQGLLQDDNKLGFDDNHSIVLYLKSKHVHNLWDFSL
ncbi:MAG: hypothetical protein AAFO91_14020, partial [Bacteroidota bacterium]